MSLEEYRRTHGGKRAPVTYGAKACVEDGIRFSSKLERDRYIELKQLVVIKQVAWFLRQVPFQLPGGIIYRADFLIAWVNPADRDTYRITVEDCKGHLTRTSENKIKQVEALYGLKVDIIRQGRQR